MGHRSIVFHELTHDGVLGSNFGIDASRVWPAQSLDVAPRGGYFLTLRWQEELPPYLNKAKKEVLTVWAHRAREESTDHEMLEALLRRVVVVLTGIVDSEDGSGGIACVEYNGMSSDFNDEGLKTITKNAGFMIVSR